MRDDQFRSRLNRSAMQSVSSSRPAKAALSDRATGTLDIKLRIPSLPKRQTLMIAGGIIGAIGLAAGMYGLGKQGTEKPVLSAATSGAKSSSAAQSNALVSIATYYPQSLPKGYTYNRDAKALKPDVLYFSVNGPNNQVFYVTQQPIPANFDFMAFNKKFLNPDSFDSESGTAIAGQVGANAIGSVRTKKNTWIIVNATNSKALPQLETVVRSLR